MNNDLSLYDKLVALSHSQYCFLMLTIAVLPLGLKFSFPMAGAGIVINTLLELSRKRDYDKLKALEKS